MSDAAVLDEVPPGDVAAEREPERPKRSQDLRGSANSKARKYLDELFSTISRGFEDQGERAKNIAEYWDCYNCVLNSNQRYNGDAEIYVPIVHDAVTARATRFANQLFPASGRYVDVTTADGKQPWEIVALVSHYIRIGKLKTKVFKPLLRNGDIEGQYNLYLDWSEIHRQIVTRETHGPRVQQDGADVELPGEDIEDISDPEDIIEGLPACEVLHDTDVLVSPATADSIDEALEAGGVVVIVRRMSKAKLDRMADDGEFDTKEVKELKTKMGAAAKETGDDVEKKLAETVGIRAKGEQVTLWEVWHKMPLNERGKFDEDAPRKLCRIWFGPDRAQLGAKRNPHWNDRCPLLSEPVEKIAGVFKGKSMVEAVLSMQYEANDAANEMADADHYAALPIVARDPEKGTGPFILNIAAIWDIDPSAIKFLEFPDLGARGLRRIQAATQQIFQSLGVNPSMMPQSTGKPKRNQAEIALEQQVDILTTAEAVSVMEEGIATPMVGWFIDLDHQFRDREITVRAYGEMGLRAQAIELPPLQNRNRWFFTWSGAEQARLNVAMQQQGIALINVLRGLRQELQAEGYQLRLGPLAEKSAINVFGAETGVQVLVDQRHQMSVPPEIENELMLMGHEAMVQPGDPDVEHIKAHAPLVLQGRDGFGHVARHIQAHMQAMRQKQAAMMMMQAAQSMQGGGQQRQRTGGTPRQGAQPAAPKPMQNPPGTVRPDNMPAAGGLTMPRRM